MDYVTNGLEFIINILVSLFSFISENKMVLSFILIPISVICIFLVIDFFFDVRDDFTEFHSFKDTMVGYAMYKKAGKKKKDKKPVDMTKINTANNSDNKKLYKVNNSKRLTENDYKRMEKEHMMSSYYKRISDFYKPRKPKNGANIDIEKDD